MKRIIIYLFQNEDVQVQLGKEYSWWCSSLHGRTVSHHKGQVFIGFCPEPENFQDHFRWRIGKAKKETEEYEEDEKYYDYEYNLEIDNRSYQEYDHEDYFY